MYGYKIATIILAFLFAGSVSVIIINSDFDNNKVLNPERYDYEIPHWVKNNAYWWSEGHITDQEFSYSMEYLINNNFVTIERCEGECL